jgi:recombination protein RecA
MTKKDPAAGYYKNLGKLAKGVNTDLKMGVLSVGSEPTLSDVKVWVPTSSHLVNLLLGGGVPVGRMLEILGDPSHGKSTLMEHMMIGFQKHPGLSILLDAESTWDRKRALAMGHNSDRHLALEADSLELGHDVIFKTVEKARGADSGIPADLPIGIFWDTVSASPPESERDGDMYKEGMQVKARKLRTACRKLSYFLPRNATSLIYVSQTMAHIKSPIPNQRKSASGGDAIMFWSSIRIKVTAVGRFDYPYKGAGMMCRMESIKDKTKAPRQRIEVPILYETGIHNEYGLILFLIDNGQFAEMKGGRVNVPNFPEPGDRVTFYMKQLPEVLEKLPGLSAYLEDCTTAVWNSGEV